MATATWQCTANGRYWLDVLVGSLPVPLMIDTGVVDPEQRVGLELEPQRFAVLQPTGKFSQRALRVRKDAGGQCLPLICAAVDASLSTPGANQPLGPSIRIHVARGVAGVPSRVGLAFFHKLPECRVVWDCAAKTWAMSVS